MVGFRLSPNCTSSARAKATGRESLSSCAAAALQISSLSSRLTGKFGIVPFDSKGRTSIYFCSTTRLWLNCDDSPSLQLPGCWTDTSLSCINCLGALCYPTPTSLHMHITTRSGAVMLSFWTSQGVVGGSRVVQSIWDLPLWSPYCHFKHLPNKS